MRREYCYLGRYILLQLWHLFVQISYKNENMLCCGTHGIWSKHIHINTTYTHQDGSM